jgi:hypothetical protein
MCILTIAMQFVAFAAALCAGLAVLTGEIPFRRRLAGLGVFLAVVCGIGAVVLLPGTEYFLYTSRALPDKGFAGKWALSPWELPTLVIPGIFGGIRSYFGPHEFRDSSDYAGLIPLSLAVLGVAAAWRANLRWVVAGVFALALAFGPVTPWGSALASLPVYGGFRNPLMWMHFFSLSLCIFAAVGWSILETGNCRRLMRAMGVALVAASVPLLVLGLKPDTAASFLAGKGFVQSHITAGRVKPGEINPVVSGAGYRAAATASVSGAAMLAAGAAANPFLAAGLPWLAVAADLWSASAGYIRTAPLRSQEGLDPVAGWLVERRGVDPLPFRAATDEYFAVPNSRMKAGIQWVSGYHSVGLGRYALLYEEARSSPSMNLLSLMNVRYIVSASGPQEGWNPEAVIGMPGGGSAMIYANNGALPRAFLVREAVSCPDFQSIMEVIRSPEWNPGVMPTDSALPGGWRTGKLVTRGTIATPVYAREEQVAKVSLRGRGILVFSENWYPAWKAYVDGKRVHIIRAYGVMRALALDPGEHEVRMIYDSWLSKIGLWLTLLVASFLAVPAICFRARGAR